MDAVNCCERLYSIDIRKQSDTDMEKPKYSQKNLSQYHSVRHKFLKDQPGLELRPPRCDV
jgi:hypothetical protein